MVQALTGADWGMAHAEWVAAHPAATCVRAATTIDETAPSERWCFACSEKDGNVLIESRFHLLAGAQDRACRLFELQITARPRDRLTLRREIESALGSQRPASTVSSEATWVERGRSTWQRLRVWRSDVRVDYLYEGEPVAGPAEPPGKLAVVLRSIEPSLLVHREQPPDRTPAPAWDQTVWRAELRRKLVVALEPEFHGAAALIQDAQAQIPETRREVVLALLRAAEGAPPERRVVLLLAADQLAEGFARSWDATQNPAAAKDWDPGIPGLTYELSDGDARGVTTRYNHDLLARVWAQLPHSEWREFAFLELQHGGWDFSAKCTRSRTPFVEVIDRGAAYLDAHPDSRWRAAQLLFLAQAHETRWTISRLTRADEHVPSLAPHGEAARQLAILFYGRILRELPQSPEAIHAQERLAQVESDLPPDQWKYYCRSSFR